MTEKIDWRFFTFENLMQEFHGLSTDAPRIYSQVMSLQLLGHVLGWEPIHSIQPKAVRHNCYSVFVGKSTVTRKSTSQNFGKEVYPLDRQAPQETSPEQFVVELSERGELFQFLPEFTGVLKGITGKGYMSRFVEVYNDLHGCPDFYQRKLRKKKGEESEFTIEKAYLSVSSTVTPEMLKENLTTEIMYGGFLPRFLVVSGVANPKPRGRLHPKAQEYENILRNQLKGILQMKKENTTFIFSDEALRRYQTIEQEAYKEYELVLPFVGRYLNYVVSFADVLLVSDAMGRSIEKGEPTYRWRQLVELVGLVSLIKLDKGNDVVIEEFSREKVTEKWLSNFIFSPNINNDTNLLIVPKQYVDRAWEIVERSLKYVMELANYVEMDKPTARLREYLKTRGSDSHSNCMRNCNLNSKQMAIAVETLVDRMEVKRQFKVSVSEDGRQYKPMWYKWIRRE